MTPKILVVDDEPDLESLVVQKFRHHLRKGDLSFIFARNGEEALQIIKDTPDLSIVLSDINMPVMDGITLLKKIKDMDPETRVVIVSAYDDMSNIRAAMNSGAFDFVTKPIDFIDFENTINKTLAEVRRQKALHRERDEAESARLRAEEQHSFLSSLLDTIPNPVFYRDVGGCFLGCNRAFTGVLNLAPEEIIGKTANEIMTAEMAEALGRGDVELMASSGAMSYAAPFIYSGYGIRDIIFSKTSFLNDTGSVAGVICVMVDITDHKRLEERIQQSQKQESLGMIAGGIAHDFNNLLMGILGNAEIAADKLPPDSSAAGNIRQIETLGRRAEELTKQMLDYSGKGQFVSEIIDLSKMIMGMKVFLESSVSKKAELKFDLMQSIPPIKGDPGQFRQIIVNILTNASEALGDGSGEITIAAGAMHCDYRLLGRTYLYEDQPEGEYVYLRISDTGCGMSPEISQRIFDPFFSTKFTGRGLGLAAVLGIVRGLKGAINVESSPGSGSVFTVFFPVTSIKTDDNEKIVSDQLADQERGKMILVVDDEEHVIEVVKEILEINGFEVLTAADGLAGLETFKKQVDKIGLVLLDLTMPLMSGLEAFTEMRKINESVPILVASGFSEEEASEKFHDNKPAGFIQKPFQLKAMINTVRELLAG